MYHEFQKGKFDGDSFWKEDSLNLHDNILVRLNMDALLQKANPAYSDTGVTEINEPQWNEICREAALLGGELAEAVNEIDPWARDTFPTHGVFTILGI